MSNTLDELIEKIAGRFDPDELVELLEISTEEILEQFPERLEEKREKFSEYEEEGLRFMETDDFEEPDGLPGEELNFDGPEF